MDINLLLLLLLPILLVVLGDSTAGGDVTTGGAGIDPVGSSIDPVHDRLGVEGVGRLQLGGLERCPTSPTPHVSTPRPASF